MECVAAVAVAMEFCDYTDVFSSKHAIKIGASEKGRYECTILLHWKSSIRRFWVLYCELVYFFSGTSEWKKLSTLYAKWRQPSNHLIKVFSFLKCYLKSVFDYENSMRYKLERTTSFIRPFFEPSLLI